jgi:uncharacterized protein YukE
MAEQIKMNFAMMEEMAEAFDIEAQTLEAITADVNDIASMLEDGALIGQAGEALSTACRGPLAGSLTRLQEKFLEAMQSAETTASGYYR